VYLRRISAYPVGTTHRSGVRGPQCDDGWQVSLEYADLETGEVLELGTRLLAGAELLTALKWSLVEELPLSALNALRWSYDSTGGRFTWTSAAPDMVQLVSKGDVTDSDGFVYAVAGDFGQLLRVSSLGLLTVNWPGGISDVSNEEVFFV